MSQDHHQEYGACRNLNGIVDRAEEQCMHFGALEVNAHAVEDVFAFDDTRNFLSYRWSA